ncbi:DUF1236 domain-containing protein [Jannaschia sp. W003]|uniref:DUF1236 domain-containing protein n=1 Tax=Jannaschia sp. W003 TaxID=2867012 RepID=UPI0021A759F2|nr:DUF1236 domain-containing protein [Jannaschia sp. W003]UWQ21013.1 DUF1236 domain-containing protein [Jannaschia sp. W003]
MNFRNTTIIAAATFALAAPAFAATATVATDLNLRAGPGSNYRIDGVLPAEAQVEVVGCTEARDWCEVTYEDMTGYAYAPYLAVQQEETLVVLPESTVEIETVTYDDTGADALLGGLSGAALASAAIGGPAAIAGGAVIGSLLGAGADPEPETVSFVRENPVEPIFIQGEPIVGATIPAEVELQTVPDTEFSYLYLNGQPVLVEPNERKIVYIVR